MLFVIYWNYLEVGGLYELKFKMDHIYGTRHFYSINLICGLWGVFLFYILKRNGSEP